MVHAYDLATAFQSAAAGKKGPADQPRGCTHRQVISCEGIWLVQELDGDGVEQARVLDEQHKKQPALVDAKRFQQHRALLMACKLLPRL